MEKNEIQNCNGLVSLDLCFFNSNVDCYNSNELMLITNEFPPYTIIKNGEFSGIAVDIVNKLSILGGYPSKIIMLPWKRALVESQNRKVLLFPYTRRPYRLKQFKWIGPIMTDAFVFAVSSDDNSKFNTIEDFRDLEIGVVQGTPTVHRLKKNGVQEITARHARETKCFKMVYETESMRVYSQVDPYPNPSNGGNRA